MANNRLMGWKASFITVNNVQGELEIAKIMKAIGAVSYREEGESTMEECIYPRDRSLAIAKYNDCIIICDDLQLVDMALDSTLAPFEHGLCDLFPQSEILSVACLSSVNFHGYSLTRSKNKIRFKTIDADGQLREWGDLLPEEKAIYDKAVERDGKTVWPESLKEDADVFEEDQLLEEFTFGMAKRHLGVRLDMGESETLFFEVPFKRIIVEEWSMDAHPEPLLEADDAKSKWVVLAIAVLAMIILAGYFLF